MHKNSLFAILLRSPWWLSFIIAGGLFAALRLLVPALYAFFFALPFIIIGCYAAWNQLRAPSAAKVGARVAALRAMDWAEFSGALEEGFRGQGYTATRLSGEAADFQLEKAGRVSLVSCKRWKAAHAGTEPLRRLKAAAQQREAHECIYVVAGELSPKAVAFAAEAGVRLLHGAELAQLVNVRKKTL